MKIKDYYKLTLDFESRPLPFRGEQRELWVQFQGPERKNVQPILRYSSDRFRRQRKEGEGDI